MLLSNSRLAPFSAALNVNVLNTVPALGAFLITTSGLTVTSLKFPAKFVVSYQSFVFPVALRLIIFAFEYTPAFGELSSALPSKVMPETEGSFQFMSVIEESFLEPL